MHSKTFRSMAWIVGTLAAGLTAQAQSLVPRTADVALTYVAERGKVADNTGCNCFWLQGAGADVAVPLPLFHGLGVAASFSGGTNSSIKPGVGLSKFTYVFGPRYTFRPKMPARVKPPVKLFAEALFGGVHGFSSIFPASTGVSTSANAFAMQLGGGIDVKLAHRIGVRAFQLDYVRTTLPNGDANVQNDLRLAFGVTYRLGK